MAHIAKNTKLLGGGWLAIQQSHEDCPKPGTAVWDGNLQEFKGVATRRELVNRGKTGAPKKLLYV